MRHFIFVNLLACVVCIPTATSAEVHITSWWDNRSAAVSFTMDDGYPGHLKTVAPALEQHGWRGTFYVIAGHVYDSLPEKPKRGATTWSQWKALADKGHEIGSHSWSHLSLDKEFSEDIYHREIVRSQQRISEKIGVTPKTFCWPFCKFNPTSLQLVQQHYTAERRYTPMYGGKTFSVQQANKWIDQAITKGSWHVAMLHAVGEKGYANLEPQILRDHLQYIADKGDAVWVDTFAQVSRYQQLAATSELTVITRDEGEISLKLSLREPTDAWLTPLTIRIPVLHQQAAAPQAHAVRSRPDAIHLDILPNGQTVTVTWN